MADTTGRRPWGRTLSDFGKPNGVGLYDAERRLLDCARTGDDCKIANARPETASDANTIRPSFLRFLALGGDAAAPVHENGISLWGAYIDGPLDLNHCDVPVPLVLVSCCIDGPLKVLQATTRPINLHGSHIAGLEGDGLATQGGLMLRNGFKATGEVRLLNAEIGGDLACRNGTFENPKGNALNADRLKTTGNVSLNDGFKATGDVRLLGANIGGNLECKNGIFENQNGRALSADGLKTAGDVALDDGFKATGEVRLLGADISGDLACRNGTFENPKGNALNADGMKTAGGVFLCDDFHATGEVRLIGANIGGNLACNKGTFQNQDGDTLSADGLKTAGDVVLNDDFKATGQVRLLGADIGGDFACRGGTFRHTSPSQADASRCAEALDLQNATVRGACFLDPKEVTGSIDLAFARVGVLADNSKGLPPPTCETEDGTVLTCHVVLDGFTYNRIGSNSSAKAKDRRSWLERQSKRDLTEDFKPQPYEQLAKVLRAMGHERDAADIVIAKKRQEMRADSRQRPRYHYAANWVRRVFFDWLIGYGYRVHRAFWLAVGIWVLSSFVFYQAAEQGVMVPSDPRVFLADDLQASCAGGNWTAGVAAWRVEAGTGAKAPHPADACDAPRMHTEHTTLHPALYALDVILPLAPLGQESTWVPSVDRDFVLSIFGLRIGWAWLPMVVMWFNIGFGWIVGLLIAAVVSGVVKRE